MSEQGQHEQNSDWQHDVWFLKHIEFGAGADRRELKIVTQNYNGPCSFIAICNILILRGDIEILPPDRQTVSYEFLSQLVAEYLVKSCPDTDISAALSKMPMTQKGMDLNPLFTGVTLFRPAGDGGELKLFEQAGIQLVHGWVVDPDSPEHAVVARAEDYDNAVNVIVAGDDASRGQLVVQEGSEYEAGPSSSLRSTGPSGDWSLEDQKKFEDALIIRQFLDSTQTQLTYHGLFSLASTLEPGSLVALFRSSHLSVLYKTPTTSPSPPEPSSSTSPPSKPSSNAASDSALYTLVTDHIFRNEPSVVWERLEDVDGTSATFVDAHFVRAAPAGGDFAGYTAESALAAYEAETGFAVVDPADRALAAQLQAEEDAIAQQMYAKQEEQRQQAIAERERQRLASRAGRPSHEEMQNVGRKKGCVIM